MDFPFCVAVVCCGISGFTCLYQSYAWLVYPVLHLQIGSVPVARLWFRKLGIQKGMVSFPPNSECPKAPSWQLFSRASLLALN